MGELWFVIALAIGVGLGNRCLLHREARKLAREDAEAWRQWWHQWDSRLRQAMGPRNGNGQDIRP